MLVSLVAAGDQDGGRVAWAELVGACRVALKTAGPDADPSLARTVFGWRSPQRELRQGS